MTEKQFYKKYKTPSDFENSEEGKAVLAKYGVKIPKAQVGVNDLQKRIPLQPLNFPKANLIQNTYNTEMSTELMPMNNFQEIPSAMHEMSLSKGTDIASKLLSGISELTAGKKKRKEAQQLFETSDIVKQASETRDEQYANMYNRPEDNIFTGEQFFPIQGVGTNVLAKYGTNVPKAAGGFNAFMSGDGGQVMGQLSGSLMKNNGGSQIGGAIGEGLGTAIGGPAGGAIGNVLGTLAGGALDTNAKKTKRFQQGAERNNIASANNNAIQGLQGHYNSYMEMGGDVPSDMSNGTLQMNPKNVKSLSYNPFLPSDGETIMFTGNSHSEGGIPIMYAGNPVEVEGNEPAVKLQNGGEEESLTVFGNLKIPFGDGKGKKFKNYINDLSKVENKQNKIVESSSKELETLNGNTSFDKLKLSSLEANMKGATMKLADIAQKKTEAAQLQNQINEIAKLKKLDAQALSEGKIKKQNLDDMYAEYGTEIPLAQNGIKTDPNKKKLSRSEADKLVKEGKFKYSKDRKKLISTTINKEEGSIEIVKNANALSKIPKNQKLNNETGLWGGVTLDQFNETKSKNKWFDFTGFDPRNQEDLKRYKLAFNKKAQEIRSDARIKDDKGELKWGKQYNSAILEEQEKTIPGTQNTTQNEIEVYDPELKEIPYKRSALMDGFNQLLPFIRPTDARDLDANQIYPEMFAMANNQLEPVQAQGYRPQLDIPYDISLQDQLNEVTSQTRATERMLGYNPAAQMNLAANSYKASNNILGEQFRMNQGMKDRVYDSNRNIMNDAQLKNLQIYDEQYQRQAQARSNTRDVAQEAVTSIAGKYQQNDLENRKLQTLENMYNYRFGNDFRIANMNGFMQPNIPQVKDMEGQDMLPVYDVDGKTLKHHQLAPKQPSMSTPGIVAKSGAKIKMNNSYFVKSLKNI